VDARERALHLLELRSVALDDLESSARGRARAHGATSRRSSSAITSSSGRERPLGLHHPELDQVPPRLALLGAERRDRSSTTLPSAIAAASM
jgi:hypothetical protein